MIAFSKNPLNSQFNGFSNSFLNFYFIFPLYWGIIGIQKLHVINIYNLVSLDICIYSCYYHHNPGNKHIHHLKNIPCVFYLVLRMLNMIYPLNKFLCVQSLIANYTPYVAQQISRSYYTYTTILYSHWTTTHHILRLHSLVPQFFCPLIHLWPF